MAGAFRVGAGAGAGAAAGTGVGVGALATGVAAAARTVYDDVTVTLLLWPVAVTSYAPSANVGTTKVTAALPFVSAAAAPTTAPLNQNWTVSPGWNPEPVTVS